MIFQGGWAIAREEGLGGKWGNPVSWSSGPLVRSRGSKKPDTSRFLGAKPTSMETQILHLSQLEAEPR